MNIRTGFAALTFVVGSLAAVPAFAQGRAYPPPPVVRPMPAPVVVVQPPLAPAQVVVAGPQMQQRANARATARYIAGARAHLNELATQLQGAINRGRVRADAAGQFNAQRAQIEALLQRAGSDGFLGAREQRMIDRQIDSLAEIRAQYRIQNGRGPRR